MDNKKDFSNDMLYSLQIGGIVAVALLLIFPVYLYMRKATRIENSLSPKKLDSFKSDTAQIINPSRQFLPSANAGYAGIDVGQRSVKYANTGSAILGVTAQTITQFTPEDFRKIGETPWSLTNTVAANRNFPSLVEVVFNNPNVVAGFLGRTTTQELLNSPDKITSIIQNNDSIIEQFFSSPAAVGTLGNENMMLAIAKSTLLSQIFSSKTGQYFIKNPRRARALAAGNKTLAPLLSNESVKKFLFAHPQTKAAAAEFYK
ncbi:MAG: hypothetical protein LBG46_02535 [Elusimicrobiota bacterium]|jgi:hypothetical protein|nr:hypothetical protein [Elusimicrobiota bacterium]